MRRAFALLILSLLPAAALGADQLPDKAVPAPTPITPAPITPAQTTPLPTGAALAEAALLLGADEPGRLTVPVTIGLSGPYDFTIDTGAERTVISRELAARLGLLPGRSVNLTAMSGRSFVDTAVIPALAIDSGGAAGTVGAKQIEAPLLSAENLGAPGLLGIDTLKDHEVAIDFDTNRMSVRPSVKRRRRHVPEPGEIVVRARSLLGQLVVSDAFYRGERIRVILDTGSVVTMGNLALRRRATGDHQSIQTISMLSVIGGRLQADYTQIGEVQIGDVVIRDLPVAFADAVPFERFGLTHQPALLLGMDAMRQFRRVEIDFANREVRFTFPRG